MRDADELSARWQRSGGEEAALTVCSAVDSDMRVHAATSLDEPIDELTTRHSCQHTRRNKP